MEKKALYAVIVIATIIVAGVAAYWVATRKPEEHFEKVVEEGDIVSVNYTIWLNETGGWEMFNMSTVNFTVGEGANIEGKVLRAFDSKVLNMTIGESKEFILEPWDAYGNWSWDNVKNISVEENISKFETVSKSEFENRTGELARNDTTFTHWIWRWNATVDSVVGDNVTIENLKGQPAPNMSYTGLTVQSTKYDWNSTVIFINQTVIKVRHNAVKDMNTTVIGGGKVLNITNQTEPLENQEIVVDLNHKLAGKTLDFEITVLSIEAKE